MLKDGVSLTLKDTNGKIQDVRLIAFEATFILFLLGLLHNDL